jgi:hypothetical protein
MLPKSQTQDTQGRHQITHDNHYSRVGLGHILPNRVLTRHLSSMMSGISFRNIEYAQGVMYDQFSDKGVSI